MYEILLGKRPFKDSARIPPVPEPLPIPSLENPLIPNELDQTILAPLQDEPDKRPEKAMDVVRLLQNAYARYRYRIWRSKERPKRTWIAASLTLALILFVFILRGLPFFKNVENFLTDFHFQWLPSHAPANSITLVSIDEASLQADPTLLVNKAEEMGIVIQRVFNAGARGIALDFLLPESWGRSESFAKLILNNQERFILASYIKEDKSLLGMECLKGLIMAGLGSEERARTLFGFLNVPPDPDGRVRRVQLWVKGQDGQGFLSMPAKAYQILAGKSLTDELMERPLWIDFSVDWMKFRKVSWKDLPALLNREPGLFRDRMVFVGGEYEGSQDFHRIPKKPGFQNEISGLLIQALALNTLVQNRFFHPVNDFLALFPLAALFMIFSIRFLSQPKVISLVILLLIFLVGYALISIFLFIHNRQWMHLGTPFLALAPILIAIFFIRRRLTFLAKPSSEGRGK
jgi:CHASE2 domain-containing sensor protein